MTKEIAQSHLDSLQRSMLNVKLDGSLEDIYDLRFQFSSAWDAIIENKEAIGKWLQQNGGDLFAEAIEEDIKERVFRK